jgi:hypothetical protein
MKTIFNVGGGRRLLIRLVMPFCSLLMGVPLAGVGGYFLLPGSWQADGGPTGPYWLGFLFGVAFLIGGIAIAIGAWLYGPAYVTRIEVDREQQLARFSVLGWVRGWSFTVRPDDIVSGRYHDGGTMVNAPWTTVRIRGRRLPLIVDAQGDADWIVVDHLLEEQALEPVPQPQPKAPEKKRSKKKKKRG